MNLAQVERMRVTNGTFTVELPKPPSVNQAFGTNWQTKRRFDTKPYEMWKREAAQMLMAQRARCAIGPVEITITIEETKNADIDNRIKPVLDCLVENGIIDGDTSKTVRKVTAQWGPVFGAVVEIAPHVRAA